MSYFCVFPRIQKMKNLRVFIFLVFLFSLMFYFILFIKCKIIILPILKLVKVNLSGSSNGQTNKNHLFETKVLIFERFAAVDDTK